MKRIVIFCTPPRRYHRWRWVDGSMGTREEPYFERQCSKCGQFESEVR